MSFRLLEGNVSINTA